MNHDYVGRLRSTSHKPFVYISVNNLPNFLFMLIEEFI